MNTELYRRIQKVAPRGKGKTFEFEGRMLKVVVWPHSTYQSNSGKTRDVMWAVAYVDAETGETVANNEELRFHFKPNRRMSGREFRD